MLKGSNQSILKMEGSNLDYVKSTENKSRTHQRQKKLNSENKCIRCGKHPHTRQNCPARDSTCYKCGKHSHFGIVCLSKLVAMLSEDPTETDPIETSYLNAVTDGTKLQNSGASQSKSMANQFHL